MKNPHCGPDRVAVRLRAHQANPDASVPGELIVSVEMSWAVIGDLDLLMTTNHGPAHLYRNDQLAGNRSIRIRLVGTKSNRDAIGATVRIFHSGSSQSRPVKGGSSYLSQSELPVTFGLGKRDRVDRVVIQWPCGRTEEYKDLAAGRAYECVESKGITLVPGF